MSLWNSYILDVAFYFSKTAIQVARFMEQGETEKDPTMTVTSHKRHGVSNHQKLDCLLNTCLG